MSSLAGLLAACNIIPLDGALGTQLLEPGHAPVLPPEAWNLRAPQRVTAVHAAYVTAGARILLTNTFGANRLRLTTAGLAADLERINTTAVRLARSAAETAPRPVLVAGSIGPSGGAAAADRRRLAAAFAEQAAALAQAGVDMLWIETMSSLKEAETAVAAVRSVASLPVCLTFSFHKRGHLSDGSSPTAVAQAVAGWPLAAWGANCGSGPAEMLTVLAAIASAQEETLPLIAKPSAGLPHRTAGRLQYAVTPAQMADFARRAAAGGARLVGGCCGTTPAHLRAIATAVQEMDTA